MKFDTELRGLESWKMVPCIKLDNIDTGIGMFYQNHVFWVSLEVSSSTQIDSKSKIAAFLKSVFGCLYKRYQTSQVCQTVFHGANRLFAENLLESFLASFQIILQP